MTLRGPNHISPRPAWPLWQRAILLSVGYFVSAWAGNYLSAPGETYVSFWLPAGLYVAVLLLSKTGDWPALCLAVLPAAIAFDYFHDQKPNLEIIGLFYLADTVQAASGAWLVRRFVAERPRLATVGEFLGVVGFAGVLSSILGAVIGASALVEFGISHDFLESCKVWWGSCTMAVLVVTPLILVFCAGGWESALRNITVRRMAEVLAVFGGLVFFVWYVLVKGGGINSPKVPVLVFILWAGMRFDLRGVAAAVFLLAVESAFLTTHFLKGIAAPEVVSGNYVFTLQVFVAVAALVGFVPGIVLNERNRTLTKLRDSEERFRTLTEAAFEGVFISENGVILDVNDQGLRMFGYERGEMAGKRILDLVAPGSRTLVEETMRKDAEVIYGHELLRKDGSTFFAEAQPKIVRISGRKIRMTALRDITERRQKEQALRESEEKFSKAFRSSPHGMSIADMATGRFIEVNEGYCRLYGYTRDEIVGHTSLELGLWKEREDRVRFIEAVKRDGTVRDLEFQTRRKNGEIKVVQFSAEAVELEGVTCLVAVLHDVTGRIQSEQADRSQRQVLEMIASGKPMEATLEALARLIESQASDMFCSILLVDEDGTHVHHAAAPSLPEAYIKAIDGAEIGPAAGSCGTAAFRREAVFVADITSDPLWKDYRQYAVPYGFHACWSTPIFDPQRKVLGTFAIFQRQPGMPGERHLQLISMATYTAAICISRHRAEVEREQAVAREQKARIEYTLQLIAAQEAERKRIAGELHDSMGQNLLLIKNLATMALRSQAPEHVYEQVSAINNLATQCIAEARQISRDLRPYQLDHLGLRRALEAMLEQTAQASDIQFNYKFEPVDELFSVEEAMNIYRIVQESLNNIMKHARATHVRIQLERDIHEVQLRIEDDGVGFVAGKLLEKKGLGLRNINERVRMLGGRLAFHSAPGEGTRIEVDIPVEEKAA